MGKGEERHWELALDLIKKNYLFSFGLQNFKENKEILIKIKELLGFLKKINKMKKMK